jgi:hypothetical protein
MMKLSALMPTLLGKLTFASEQSTPTNVQLIPPSQADSFERVASSVMVEPTNPRSGNGVILFDKVSNEKKTELEAKGKAFIAKQIHHFQEGINKSIRLKRLDPDDENSGFPALFMLLKSINQNDEIALLALLETYGEKTELSLVNDINPDAVALKQGLSEKLEMLVEDCTTYHEETREQANKNKYALLQVGTIALLEESLSKQLEVEPLGLDEGFNFVKKPPLHTQVPEGYGIHHSYGNALEHLGDQIQVPNNSLFFAETLSLNDAVLELAEGTGTRLPVTPQIVQLQTELDQLVGETLKDQFPAQALKLTFEPRLKTGESWID